jgi:hypothetical protein
LQSDWVLDFPHVFETVERCATLANFNELRIKIV